MRTPIALLLGVATAVAIAVAVVAASRDERPGARGSGSVTLVGDSLGVGIEPYLAAELDGWRIDAHDRVGRATREGVDELRRLDGRLSPVVVVSLGTNDAAGTEDAFRGLVEEVVRLAGPDRCVVWATIVRDGAARAGFNEVLERARAAHPGLRLVDWAAMVADNGSLLAPDLVHGTPEGYARRAEETARAVRACPRPGG